MFTIVYQEYRSLSVQCFHDLRNFLCSLMLFEVILICVVRSGVRSLPVLYAILVLGSVAFDSA